MPHRIPGNPPADEGEEPPTLIQNGEVSTSCRPNLSVAVGTRRHHEVPDHLALVRETALLEMRLRALMQPSNAKVKGNA